jgi:hypothetical protein
MEPSFLLLGGLSGPVSHSIRPAARKEEHPFSWPKSTKHGTGPDKILPPIALYLRFRDKRIGQEIKFLHARRSGLHLSRSHAWKGPDCESMPRRFEMLAQGCLGCGLLIVSS